MKNWKWTACWFGPLLMAGLVMICGCESGEKALDEATGNRAVKQYHQSKKDIERVTSQQIEKLKSIPD